MIQTIPNGLWLPQVLLIGSPNFASILLDAANEKTALIFRVPKTGTITKIGWRTTTVTTGATLDIRLETVSLTNGDPTGTLQGTDTNGAQVVADADDNVWFMTTLTAGAVVTRGDILAIVIVNPAVSPGNLNIASFGNFLPQIFPYRDDFLTGAWVKGSALLSLALEYSDGTYGAMSRVPPMKTFTAVAFNSGTTPDERGLYFRLPFPVLVSEFWDSGTMSAGDFDARLYDEDGATILLSTSVDKDLQSFTSNGLRLFPFSSTATLKANTFYRFTLLPTSASSITLNEFDVDSFALMDATDCGQNFHHTSRTDAGAWTQTTTKRPFMGLVCDGFDDGTVSPRTRPLHKVA